MSRVNFGAKPVMYPMPVLIIATYDENGVPDAMNAAWGIITDMNEISISMSEHKTTENLAKTGAFTVSIGTEDTVVACDYVGVESAKKVPDKFSKSGFHAATLFCKLDCPEHVFLIRHFSSFFLSYTKTPAGYLQGK